jgi:RNA polymerase sigma-70 factor (ECF subfamily)
VSLPDVALRPTWALGRGHTGGIEEDQPSVSSAVGLTANGLVAEDFATLFETHYPRVVRALQLTGLDRTSAEDVAAEAFVRTLSHWRRVRRGTNPAGYVFTTAFRLARRLVAKRREVPLEEWSQPTSDESGEVATRLAAERVIGEMPPRRRACAVACFVVGMSTKEAASALGIAEGTVRKQLALAREALAEALSS